MRTRLLATVCLMCGSACSAWAHPGHGHPDIPDGPAHYLTSPQHYGPPLLTVAVAALTLTGVIMLGRWRRRGPAESTAGGR